MVAAIDIGNTSTVIGIYRKDALLADCRLTRSVQRSKDKIIAQIQSLLVKAGLNKKEIRGIGISSVVPDLTTIYRTISKTYFHLNPMIVSSKLDLGFTIHYDDPASLGSDRICSAAAGYHKYGGPLIIIDFGTATTYNVIGSQGDFLGGVIAPGIETSAISLYRRTANLPRIAGTKLQIPESVICTNTEQSIQAGVLRGALDAMAGMVARIKNELPMQEASRALVIATGGYSNRIAAQTQIIQHVEPALVLDGIRLIFDRVNNKRGI
ncbi:MAG: type III pantothenate kinase [Ignavibacteriae bacterium]|nr:MAG: type III pantothenate kinase [Ignavibacteriota bacterium]